jgi:sugar/nucleoside kinase (ribokinase family)
MSSTERPAAPGRGRVTVVGNPGLDTLVLLQEELPDLRADGHFVRNVDTVGHASAFTARDMARLGHETRILGAVGEGPIGRLVAEVLNEDGVDTSLLFTDPTGTARSVNFITPDGRRTYFYDGGSHMTLTPPADFADTALDGADLVLASIPNWARHVLATARARGVLVAVDLQDVRDPLDPYLVDFIASADHVFASAAHLEDPRAAAEQWFRMGPARTVVLGMGPKGAMVVERGAGGSVRVTHQCPPEVDLPIVDTTGAGDALASGFLDGLVFSGLGVEASLRRGQVLARLVATDLGGSAGFDRAHLDHVVAGST